MILETERLLIRQITIDDKNEIFEYRQDKETNKYQGWIPETIEDVEVFIGKISTQINPIYSLEIRNGGDKSSSFLNMPSRNCLRLSLAESFKTVFLPDFARKDPIAMHWNFIVDRDGRCLWFNTCKRNKLIKLCATMVQRKAASVA